jgi:hypothetical protein
MVHVAATTFVADWDEPTVLQIYNDDTNFTTSSHVIEVDEAGEWEYFIKETTNSVPSPHSSPWLRLLYLSSRVTYPPFLPHYSDASLSGYCTDSSSLPSATGLMTTIRPLST